MIKVRQYPKGEKNSGEIIRIMLNENIKLYYSLNTLISIVYGVYLYQVADCYLMNFEIQDKKFIREIYNELTYIPLSQEEINGFSDKFVNTGA